MPPNLGAFLHGAKLFHIYRSLIKKAEKLFEISPFHFNLIFCRPGVFSFPQYRRKKTPLRARRRGAQNLK